MENTLKLVIEFADKAHGDQLRKYSPDRYIVHPIRVMQTVKEYLPSLPVLSAALLHDVLEDTDTSEQEIKDFLLTVMNEEEAKTNASTGG